MHVLILQKWSDITRYATQKRDRSPTEVSFEHNVTPANALSTPFSLHRSGDKTVRLISDSRANRAETCRRNRRRPPLLQQKRRRRTGLGRTRPRRVQLAREKWPSPRLPCSTVPLRISTSTWVAEKLDLCLPERREISIRCVTSNLSRYRGRREVKNFLTWFVRAWICWRRITSVSSTRTDTTRAIGWICIRRSRNSWKVRERPRSRAVYRESRYYSRRGGTFPLKLIRAFRRAVEV